MKSVDQQGGERVTVTYHVPPPLLVPDPGPYMWGDYTEKTPTNLHARSVTHMQLQIYIQKYHNKKQIGILCMRTQTHKTTFGKFTKYELTQKLTRGSSMCSREFPCTKIFSSQVAFLLFNSFSLHIFLISCGISTCKTPRFAWLNILTSWLLYFQTVLLFPTIFSSFPLLESSLRLLLIHCPDGFSACQRILFPPLLVAWI